MIVCWHSVRVSVRVSVSLSPVELLEARDFDGLIAIYRDEPDALKVRVVVGDITLDNDGHFILVKHNSCREGLPTEL